MENQELIQYEEELDNQLSIFTSSPEFVSNYEEVKELLMDYITQYESWDITSIYKSIDATKAGPRERAFINLAVFHWTYECYYGFLVNFLCFLLVANGRRVRTESHTCSLNTIEGMLTSEKVAFLRQNRFGMFSRRNDNILRNKIAHFKVRIDSEGKIITNGEEVELLPRHGDLLNFISDSFIILWRQLRKHNIIG